MLPEDIVRDVACSGTRIFRTPREVIRTSRDGSTPRDVNTAIATDILTPPRKNFNSTSNSPTWNRNQDIASSRRSVITTTARNADPLDAPINQILDSHGHPKSIFSKVIGSKIVSGESADIYARERMDIASNFVVAESPNFMDFGLSPANTIDKLKSVIGTTTKVEGLTDSSDCLATRHICKEVTVGRVSGAKVFIEYIKNNEF